MENPPFPPIVLRWILHIVIKCLGEKVTSSWHSIPSTLETFLEQSALAEDLSPEEVFCRLKTHYNALPTLIAIRDEYPEQLRNNLDKLADLIGLSETEWHLLGLSVLLHTEPLFLNIADEIEQMTFNKLAYLLADLLHIPVDKIRVKLSAKSLLCQSGLLKIDTSRHRRCDFSDFLDLLTNNFALTMRQHDFAITDLLRDVIDMPPPPELESADFSHIDSQLSLLIPYLNSALNEGKKGVNVFIYGVPGTGKTQLSRLLAALTNSDCLEVSCQDDDGESASAHERRRAYKTAQAFFARQRTLLVFDEVEEIFGGGRSLFFQPKQVEHKSWLNHSLENNCIPTIWLSNEVDMLDDAFIRRFDMIFELPIPPKKQRQTIINRMNNGTFTQQFIERLSDNEHIAPAVIARAANVVQTAQLAATIERSEYAETQMTMLINHTLEAQNKPTIKSQSPILSVYSPEYINTDRDMCELVMGIQNAPSARLFFYGRPGTGKTAYAKYLAEQLDKPLVSKRASDLLSPFVGMAEKYIASAFREAERDNAILLIDEADSFLRDRNLVKQSWEISQVNEMLTQIEAFSGIFIATTNLMDDIDPASMRRFDMKLCFHYLTERQSTRLLSDYAELLGLKAPNKRAKDDIAELTNLTAGDFAAVARQHCFAPFNNASAFVKALIVECQYKLDATTISIGFC